MSSPLENRLEALQQDFRDTWTRLSLDDKLATVEQLEAEVAEPEIWLNPDHAREQNEKLAHLTDETEPWKLLKIQLDDLNELIILNDPDLNQELETQLSILEANLAELKKALRFTGKFDHQCGSRSVHKDPVNVLKEKGQGRRRFRLRRGRSCICRA